MSAATKVEAVGAIAPDAPSFAFSDENQAEVKRILAKFPADRAQSGVLPLLHLAQKQHGGWLPKAALDHVAEVVNVPKIRVYEVASFYDMYNTVPTAPCQIRVCTTTPCWLRGSDEVVRACKDALGVEVDQNTPDGKFFLREFECLGACANAPILWVDDDFYEDLDYESTTRIVEALKRGERPAAGSAQGRQASMAVGGRTSLHDLEGGDGKQRSAEPSEFRGQEMEPIEEAKPADPDRHAESSEMIAKNYPKDAAVPPDAPQAGDERGDAAVQKRDEG